LIWIVESADSFSVGVLVFYFRAEGAAADVRLTMETPGGLSGDDVLS